MSQVQRVAEFDTWRPGYAGAEVDIFLPGTTTRASVFYDAALTAAAPNPQTLQANTVDEVAYGKFAQTLYVGTPYYLRIDGAEATGVVRPPMTSLVGEDASEAEVTAAIGTAARPLEDWMSDEIRTEAWGEFGANATTNTSILASAIGAAAAQGGGAVLLPAGTITFNAINLPAGVVLTGRGKSATTLRSTLGEAVVTVSGHNAGLRRLTLDGVSLTGSSLGLFAVGVEGLVLDAVQVKRFAQGVELRGASLGEFNDFFISNCTRGIDFRGDTDAGNGGDGGAIDTVRWTGGRVGECTEYGARFFVEDAAVARVEVSKVAFENNTGTALAILGGQMLDFRSCRFVTNTATLSIADGSDVDDTPTEQVEFRSTLFRGGTMDFAGACSRILFQNCDLDDVDLDLETPHGHIMLMDCVERVTTTATGNTEKLVRSNRFHRMQSYGVTTDATPTAAFVLPLVPAEHARITARVIAKARTGDKTASYEISAAGYRQSNTVTYGSASGTIPFGELMTGQTSGAIARVPGETPAGTFVIRPVQGEFVSGETVEFESAVTAVLTGPVIEGIAVLAGSVEVRPPTIETDTDWDATFDASSINLRLIVTGEAGLTVEWAVEAEVFRF